MEGERDGLFNLKVERCVDDILSSILLIMDEFAVRLFLEPRNLTVNNGGL